MVIIEIIEIIVIKEDQRMIVSKTLPLSKACFSLLVVLAGVLFAPAQCLATTYTVDPSAPATAANFQSLSALLAALTLHGGDVVKIKSGVVYRDRIKFTSRHSGAPGIPVMIESDGPDRAVWDGSTTDVNQYGYLWQFDETSHDIEVRRIEVRNVQPGPDRNNRGVYVRGVNITVRECYVHHNPNGITSGLPAGNTVIESCEVAFNGLGDGYTHNFYMQATGTHIRYNYIHDANGGINYKDRSLADATGVAVEFSYNWVESAPGAYELDFSSNSAAGQSAQDAYLVGNIILKSAAAANYVIVVFGNDGRRGTLRLSNNTIIAGNELTRMMLLSGGNPAEFDNNIYDGSTRLFASGSNTTVSGMNNWLMTGTTVAGLANSIFGSDPGFIDRVNRDYHLQSKSAAVSAGSAALAPLLIPGREFAGRGSVITRTDAGRTIGAFAATSTIPVTPLPPRLPPRDPKAVPSLPIRRTGPRKVVVIR